MLIAIEWCQNLYSLVNTTIVFQRAPWEVGRSGGRAGAAQSIANPLPRFGWTFPASGRGEFRSKCVLRKTRVQPDGWRWPRSVPRSAI